MGESVFPLNDKDRTSAVQRMSPEIADYLDPDLPHDDRAIEGCAERCLAALESAGYVILPPDGLLTGHAECRDGSMRVPALREHATHRRVIGPWQPVEDIERETMT